MPKKKMFTGTVTMANGKRKYIRSTNKEEFDKKMQQARLEAGQGIDLTDNTTFGEFAQLWFSTYKKPDLREDSAADLLYILNAHIMPTLSTLPLRSIKPLHIKQLMGSKKQYSQSVQRKILQNLRGIFAAAVENSLIVSSPVSGTIKAKGAPAEEETPLTVEQSRMLLRATQGTRAHVAIALMLGAGLRREEVCGLMWADIDLDAGIISVQHAKSFSGKVHVVSTELKSEAAYRDIPIQDWLVKILKAEKRVSDSAFVLSMANGKSLTHASWQSLWHLVTVRTTDNPELLNKPIDEKHPQIRYGMDFHCHPHQLRHTCITRWVEAGLDIKEVQYLAGHKTPDLTMRIYAHYDKAGRHKETVRKIQGSEILNKIKV